MIIEGEGSVVVWRMRYRGVVALGGFFCVESVWDVVILRVFLRQALRLTHAKHNMLQTQYHCTNNNNNNNVVVFAMRHCATWASTLTTHKHSPKEENHRNKKATYAQSLNSLLNLLSAWILLSPPFRRSLLLPSLRYAFFKKHIWVEIWLFLNFSFWVHPEAFTASLNYYLR